MNEILYDKVLPRQRPEQKSQDPHEKSDHKRDQDKLVWETVLVQC